MIDRIASYSILGLYFVLILFGLISLTNPSWLQTIAEPGRETEARTLSDEANKEMYGGNFKNAVSLYEQALKIDSANRNIHGNLGIAFMKLGAFDEADKCFQQVKRLSKGLDSMAYFNYYESVGNLEKQIGLQKQQIGGSGLPHLNKALQHYRKAIQIMPYEPKLIFKYAHLLMLMGKDSLSIINFNEGIAKNQNLDTYYYGALLTEYLPAIANKQEDMIAGIEELLNSKEPVNWGKYDIQSINKYQMKNDLLVLVYINLGELYYRNGDKELAESAFLKCLNINRGMLKKVEEIKKKY